MSLSDFQPSYLQIIDVGEIVTIRFNDERLTDEDNIEQLGHELFAVVDQFGKRKVILDLTGLKMITSSVLGKMITLHRRLHRLEGKMVISNAGDYVTEILKTARLHDYFHVASNNELASNMFA